MGGPAVNRARAPRDKAARRDAILAAAGRLFDARGPQGGGPGVLTMSALAREAGLAKGTLYLYFRTKEEIFLALVLAELAAWLGALEQGLDELHAPLAPLPVAQVVARSVRERSRLLRLLGVLHPVLEQNLEAQALLSFKLALAELLAGPATRMELRLPVLAPGDGARLLQRLHVLIVGLSQAARPVPAVAAILDRPELACMRLDFDAELIEMVAAILRGWR